MVNSSHQHPFLAVACALALFASMRPVAAHTLEGLVIGITDGDTLKVLVNRQEIKVRVSGIDAPEKKQAFSNAAKEHLSACLFGKNVSVQWNKTDRYGRTVGKVTADGVDCGLRQVQDGLAWHYKVRPEKLITH